MQGGEEFTWRGGGSALLVRLLRWRCCGGDRWRCCGSRTATPSSGERGYCSSLLLCFLSSSFVLQMFPFILSVCFFLISYPVSSFSFLSLCFGSSLSILSVLSLSVIFFSSVCSLLPSVPSPLSSSRAGVQSLFIGALDFSSSRCVGLWVFCRANGSQELMKKEKKTAYLHLLHVQGKEKKEQCRSKRHCSALFFFNMKRRHFI